ncbi:MAG: hypothetical protein RL563_2815, partial [Pseudomonadota bacterium]
CVKLLTKSCVRCSDEALKAHGAAYIFEKRTASVRTKLLILTFFGLAGPWSVGALISTYQLATDTAQIMQPTVLSMVSVSLECLKITTRPTTLFCGHS